MTPLLFVVSIRVVLQITTMRPPKLHLIVLVLLVSTLISIDGKRSRGRSRGSSGSSSSSFWSRKSKGGTSGGGGGNSEKVSKPTQSVQPPAKPLKPVASEKPKPAVAAAEKPQPSAPVQAESAIKRENANLQQNSPNSGRPIGWNVDGQNAGAKQQHLNPSQSGYPGQSPNTNYNSGGYPNANSGSYPNANPGTYANTNPGNYPHASYPNANPGNYPQAGYPNANPGNYPHASYPNANPGNYPQAGYPNANPGNYPHASYPNANPGYPGNGGYPNYPQQSYPGHYNGMGGNYGTSWFGGGKKPGFGGFGGYGGYGALAGYGMKKKSGGLLGKHPVRNVLGGLFVWYLISGLTSRPYRVYNYYNQPPEEREEITLPANLLTLCSENMTTLCVPGTYALCTTNNSILCVASMTSTTPCEDDGNENCVASKIKCDDLSDPLCQNRTSVDNTASVSLPCFTNMTLDTTHNGPDGVQIPFSEDHRYCVTALATPDNTPMNSTDIPTIIGNNTDFAGVPTTLAPITVNVGSTENSTVIADQA